MTSKKIRSKTEARARAAGWSLVRTYRRSVLPLNGEPADGPLAVVVHSFDGYKRFWRPVLHFTSVNLPHDRPVFVASEEQSMNGDRTIPILTGPGAFGDRMRRAIKRIEQLGFRYVLYLQEDMWISEPVGEVEMEQMLDLMVSHDLDALKLADIVDPPPEFDEMGRVCARLESGGLGARVRWFGAHDYVFSHHTTIFKTSFLMEVLTAASLFRRVRPLQQEQFCSAYLKWRTVASEGDGGRYRVASFAEDRLVQYIHASEMGRLTDEAAHFLEVRGLSHLYDPEIPGEYFPEQRSRLR